MDNLFSEIEPISTAITRALESNKILEILNQLSDSETAVFSFFFLPVFLLLWLGVFKLFDYGVKAKQIASVVVIAVYIGSISFLKIEAKKNRAYTHAEYKVVYYMANNFKLTAGIDEVLASTTVTKDQILALDSRKGAAFMLSGASDEVHLQSADILSIIAKRLEKLGEVLTDVSKKRGEISVSEIVNEAKSSDFANLSNEIVEKVAKDSKWDLQLKSTDSGDVVTAKP